MLVVSGVPRSGKARYAEHLRDDLGWRWIESDNLTADGDLGEAWMRVLTRRESVVSLSAWPSARRTANPGSMPRT
jgi:tRNA uridine 5-carbamoylmethylation protein Kti12